MRQPRIKRESDPSQAADGDPTQYLSVPRVERQCSEPLPALSPPPGHLLTVPGAVLVKQHSHPLLPSQIKQVHHIIDNQFQFEHTSCVFVVVFAAPSHPINSPIAHRGDS